MKKFSVLFVAMLIALMLFVGCESKPKERAATADDLKVIAAFSIGSTAYANSEEDIPGVTRNRNGDTLTVEFKEAEIKDSEGNVVAVLNGTYVFKGTKESGSVKIDLTSGTQFNGTPHKIYMTGSSTDKVPEVILDGYKLTGLDSLMKI